MPITFTPGPNDVLMCEFGPDPRALMTEIRRGPLAVPPEIWKKRQVVVVSHGAGGTCLVVPFSTEAPRRPRGYHHRIPVGTYPFFEMEKDSWVKADMMEAVSYDRLDRVQINGRFSGASLSNADFRAVQACVLDALSLSHLKPHL
jgi:uncharacterized protein YifN (PemK superfamily)